MSHSRFSASSRSRAIAPPTMRTTLLTLLVLVALLSAATAAAAKPGGGDKPQKAEKPEKSNNNDNNNNNPKTPKTVTIKGPHCTKNGDTACIQCTKQVGAGTKQQELSKSKLTACALCAPAPVGGVEAAIENDRCVCPAGAGKTGTDLTVAIVPATKKNKGSKRPTTCSPCVEDSFAAASTPVVFALCTACEPGTSTFGKQGASKCSPIVPGLSVSWYALSAPSVIPDFSALTPYKTAIVDTLDFPDTDGPPFANSGRANELGGVFTGWIVIPASGKWTLYSRSDDGSKMYIGSTLVVNNDEIHPSRETSGEIELPQGRHPFRLEFFENRFFAGLTVSWEGPGVAKSVVPASAWVREG